MMSEKPILFSGEMVRAIRQGKKTQTRRVIKLDDHDMWELQDLSRDPLLMDGEGGTFTKEGWVATFEHLELGETYHNARSPFGGPGDALWVRETWGVGAWLNNTKPSEILERTKGMFPWVYYREDEWACDAGRLWRPSIHMPRWASRLQLEVVDVRVRKGGGISWEWMVDFEVSE